MTLLEIVFPSEVVSTTPRLFVLIVYSGVMRTAFETSVGAFVHVMTEAEAPKNAGSAGTGTSNASFVLS